jgi:hypothetical protein
MVFGFTTWVKSSRLGQTGNYFSGAGISGAGTGNFTCQTEIIAG